MRDENGGEVLATNQWWDDRALQGTEPGAAMVQVCKAIQSSPQTMRDRGVDMRMVRLYENDPALVSLYQFGDGPKVSASSGGDLSGDGTDIWNGLRAVVDTASAEISSKTPRIRAVTNGGNYTLKRRAKLLAKFVAAIFDETDMYELTQQAFVDACIFKYGVIQVYRDKDRVAAQRVLPFEILVDPTEGAFQMPRSLYRRRPMDKDAVRGQFLGGKSVKEQVLLERAIEAAPSVDAGRGGNGKSRLIWVWEGYHLPWRADGSDGRHRIAIEGTGGTLLDEKYKRQRFPFLFFRWANATMGFGGKSLSDIIAPTQLEIRRLIEKISRSERLACVPRVALPRGSKIIKSHINNKEGSYIEFTGQPPLFLSPQALSPEVYRQLERHWDKLWEIPGVARNLGTGSKPQGVISGQGQRDAKDIASQRFAVVQQRWDKWHIKVAGAVIDEAK
ncbi:MAG TPA: hypothetical protein VFH73_08735, partial [Polyangia bacterium]|nr:hypothetical protein [Polyangia bacterium]